MHIHTRILRYTLTIHCRNPAILARRTGLEVLMLISIALSEPTLCHAFATMNQVQHLQAPAVTTERFATDEVDLHIKPRTSCATTPSFAVKNMPAPSTKSPT